MGVQPYMTGQGRVCLPGDSAMRPTDRAFAYEREQLENNMRALTIAVLAIGFMSGGAAAQSSAKPQCPAGYDLIGTVCQNGSTGDVVLPN